MTTSNTSNSNGCTWNHTKWASGKYELWCYYELGNDVAIKQSLGSLFTSIDINPPTLPTDILIDSNNKINPVINKTLTSNWANVFIMNASAGGKFKIACTSSVDACAIIMNYYVIGRWK